MNTSTRCRACGQAIAWAKTKNGKSIPLNLSPQTNGNIQVVDGIARVGFAGSGPYTSHFVTCPAAAEFRRPAR